MIQYSGAWPVIPTPYTENGEIDRAAYRTLIEWYIQQRAGGLYTNCLTSEMYALTPAERLLLVSEAVAVSAGRVPIAATGNFGATPAEHAAFCRQVAAAGADIVMLVVPETIPDDEALEAYLMRLAGEVDARLGLYECPVPRPYHLGIELVRKLAHTGRFFAFKETSCDPEKITALVEATRGTALAYLQANTPYLLDSVRMGAPGTMSIAAGFAPEIVQKVIEYALASDPRADALHDRLCAMELGERVVHPMGMKYLLAKRGLPFSMRSRTAQPLSPEVIRALDSAARVWFAE